MLLTKFILLASTVVAQMIKKNLTEKIFYSFLGLNFEKLANMQMYVLFLVLQSP